jgi:predicted RNase H-like nuclease (RuvC/YqgF family)
MAIKHLIAFGIGFSTGSDNVHFIPTLGYSVGEAVEPPVVVAAPASTGGWETTWTPKPRRETPREDIPDTLEPETQRAEAPKAPKAPQKAREARALQQEVTALRARFQALETQEKALQRVEAERRKQQAQAAALSRSLAALDAQIAEAEAQEAEALQNALARIDEEIQLRQIQLTQAEAEARRQAEIEDDNTAITLILGMIL